MFKLTRRSLWEHKRRLILTLVAIMLGVGFMAGTFVLSDTMDRAFDDLFAEGSEEVDAQVQGEVLFSDPFGGMGDQRKLLDAALLEEVRAVDGVAEAEPYVIAIGFGASNRVLGKDGEAIGVTQGPPTLIENWYDNPDLSAYDLTEGRGPESDDEIALNVAAVEEGEFELGDQVTVLTQFGPKDYTLVGQFLFGTAKSSAGAISADFTLAEAQRLAGTDGQIQQVLAKAEDGISQDELVDRIAPVLPGDAEVITGVEAGEQLSSDVQSGFAFFQTFLSIFGGIALLVGVFVISNTFSILVAQRTRELALLRAVGARRGQVMGSVLVEAIMVGLVGAGLGLGFGLLLASGVTAAFASFGAELPTEGLALRPGTVLTALLIGLVVTLVASLAPAIRSTRVAPIAALRDVAFERTGPSRTRIALGLVAAALGAFNLTAGWRGGSDTEDVPVVGFGGLLLVLAAIVVGPVLTGPTIRFIGRLVPRLGIHGRLAVENAARSPKRTSATASALIIGMALVGLIGIFSSSAEASITEEVGRGFEGDFAVTAGGGFTGPSPFPPVIADQVAEVPGVEAAVGLGFGRAEFELPSGKTIGQFLSAVDPTQLEGVLDPRMTEGEVADLTDDGIIVDVGEAEDHDIAVGDEITITFAGGATRQLEVQAISDEENLLGYYTISRATFLAEQQNPQDFMVFGRSEPGTDLEEVLGRIEAAVADVPTIEVVDRDGFIGSIADSITAFVNVINALLVLSVIIATIGIANTLSLAIHERTRELGLLRAVGMTRKQLRSSIRWEAILIAVLGTAVGFVLAVVISRCLLQALESSGLIAYRIPVGTVVTLAVVSILVGVIAAFFPSRRAARMAVLDAIATS